MAETMLDSVRVGEIMHDAVCDAITISPDATIDELLKRLVKGPRSRHVYVVDRDNRLIGSVRLHGLIDSLFPVSSAWEGGAVIFISIWESLKARHVADLMNSDPPYVTEDTTLDEMITTLRSDMSNEIAVVDENMQIVGEVNLLEVIERYLRHRQEEA